MEGCLKLFYMTLHNHFYTQDFDYCIEIIRLYALAHLNPFQHFRLKWQKTLCNLWTISYDLIYSSHNISDEKGVTSTIIYHV